MYLLEYGKKFLVLGCFYLEFSGGRILRCCRYLLPILKSSGRKNYSIEVLRMLCQFEFELPPRQLKSSSGTDVLIHTMPLEETFHVTCTKNILTEL